MEPRDDSPDAATDRVEPRESTTVVLPHGAFHQLDGERDEQQEQRGEQSGEDERVPVDVQLARRGE